MKALVAYAHRDGHETKPNSKTKAFPTDWSSDAVLGRVVWVLSDQHQFNLTGDFYRKSADTTDISASLFSNYKSDATQQQDIDRTQFSLEHIYKPETLVLFDQLKSKIWYQESNNETATSFMNNANTKRDFSTTYKEKNTGIKFDATKNLEQQTLKYGLAVDQKDYSSTKVDLRNGETLPTLY